MWPLLTIIGISFISIPLFASHAQVLDPNLKILMRLAGGASPLKKSRRVGKSNAEQTDNNTTVGVFIKTRDLEELRSFLQNNSGKINSVIGDIVTAQIPLDIVSALKNVKGVVYVELAQPVKTNLNVSRTLIGADQVHNGTNLSRSYTGRGVIVGIVDTGIDWQHSTFKEGINGSRVKFIWDQSLSPSGGFTAPREIANTYGLECDERDLDMEGSGLCPSRDRGGHGTHVAGIAAGGDRTFKGIAPDAEIIAVKIPEAEGVAGDYTYNTGLLQSFSNHVVDGVNYIFQKASALGMPAVINLSLGTHFGPHDSTSLFEQALNNLVTGAPGQSIVVAAGNETNISGSYFASVHAGFPLQDETKAVEFVSQATWLHSLIIDIWQPADSHLSFGIGVDDYKNYQKSPMVSQAGTTDFATADGQLNVLIDSSEIQNPLNGKKHTLVYIVASQGNDGVAVAASKYVFDLIVEGRGHFDAWIALGGAFTKRTGTLNHTGFTYQSGDSQRTVDVPATASKVLAVASYSSRNNFDNISGLTGWLPDIASLVIGEVSSFSSVGPTVDPTLTGQKPEIAAPGEWVLSAMSSSAQEKFVSQNWPRTSSFVSLAGTSMAAPHVTGAIALLLERNRLLPADNIKRRLFLTADSGLAVGITPIPNNRLGYGKLNVDRAIRYDDFVSSGYDFNSRELLTSLEAVPEIAYDGGVTDAENFGITNSKTAKRGGLQETLIANPSNENSVGGVSNDPLEPVAGGCSFLSQNAFLNPLVSFLFFIFVTSTLLFILRVKKGSGKFGLIVFALFVLSGCGGSGNGGGNAPAQSNEPPKTDEKVSSGSTNSPAAQNAPVNLLTSLDLSKEQGQIFFQDGWAVSITINLDRTKMFALFMPFKHLFVGETVPLGADGLYGFNPDEGFLVIYEGKNFGSSNAQMTATYVATSGSFNLNEASIRQNSYLRGTFQVNQIVSIDLSTILIQRGKEQITLSSSFSAAVAVGGTGTPYIVESGPKSLPIGTDITIRGLNMENVRRVWFSECGYNFSLPFETVSHTVLKVHANQFGCKIKEGLSILYAPDNFSSFTSFSTAKEFEVQIPYLQNFAVTNPWRMIYDPLRQFVYIEDSTDRRLRILSIPDNKFLTTAYASFANLYAWDITADGTLLGFFNNYYANRMTLFNLAGIGGISDLNGSTLNLSVIPYATDSFFLGKGRKGLVGTDYGLKLVDLNTGAFISLPSALSSNFYSGYDSLFRSQNREYIVLNMGNNNPYSGAATAVYHALEGGEFEKISASRINKKILGVAETARELWSVDSIFDLNLVQQGTYGAGIPDWNFSTAVGIVFDPSHTYAILISNKGVAHILNRATKAILAINVPLINIQNKSLLNQYIMSNDGTRLMLSSSDYLHFVDLTALFLSLSLPYS